MDYPSFELTFLFDQLIIKLPIDRFFNWQQYLSISESSISKHLLFLSKLFFVIIQ